MKKYASLFFYPQMLESIGVKLYQSYFYSRESLYNAARSFSSHI